jgi:hypothetical protein
MANPSVIVRLHKPVSDWPTSTIDITVKQNAHEQSYQQNSPKTPVIIVQIKYYEYFAPSNTII